MKHGLSFDSGKYLYSGTLASEIEEHGDKLSAELAAVGSLQQVAQHVRQSATLAADLLIRTAADEARHRFLSEVSARLFASLDENATLTTLSQVFVPALADGSSVFVFRDAAWRCAAAAHVDAEKESIVFALGAGFCRDVEKPAGLLEQVMRQRACVLFTGQAVERAFGLWSDDPDMSRMIAQLEMRWVVGLPLVLHNRVLGAILLYGSSGRSEWHASETTLLQELAHRASVAIDNTQLYETARERIRAREHLMAVVSHDLRNALSLALMSSSVLAAPLDGANSTNTARLVSLRKGLGRMVRLIDDLLDFASIEAGHLSLECSEHAAATLLGEALEMFREQAERKSIRLMVQAPSDSCVLECDQGRILQVLSNLIGNALKFTPAGGSVTLSVVGRGEEIEFAVSDTGSGISPSELSRVFEAYYRASPTCGGGKGLGLAITKGIVESHGGKVWVESPFSQGTTFFFRLPKRQPVVSPMGQVTPVPPRPQ
jgi:signal transduction histidine kinase